MFATPSKAQGAWDSTPSSFPVRLIVQPMKTLLWCGLILLGGIFGLASMAVVLVFGWLAILAIDVAALFWTLVAIGIVALIVLDTLRADRTSLCGYEHPTTPTLESVRDAGGIPYGIPAGASVHPLGGLCLGDTPATGAVDARTAQLFGFENLYVVDASIIPVATGPNPSLTIAALAEMYAERLCEKHS